MSHSKNEFSESVKRIIAQRAGYRCSYPGCTCGTIGPAEDSQKSVNVGEACHICAASPRGARYDSNMSTEERSSVDNGIWMCRTHAAEIDRDTNRYTVEVLRGWKIQAEKRANDSRVNYFTTSDGFNNKEVDIKKNFGKIFIRHQLLYRNLVIGIYVMMIGLIPLLRRIHIVENLSLMDRIIIATLIISILLVALWKIETDPEVASKVYSTITETDILEYSPGQLMAEIIGSYGERVFITQLGSDDFQELVLFRRMTFGGWERDKINYLEINIRFTFEYYDPTALYLHPFNTRNTTIRMLSSQGFVLQKQMRPDLLYLKKECLHVYASLTRSGFLKRVMIINCKDSELQYRYERLVRNDKRILE